MFGSPIDLSAFDKAINGIPSSIGFQSTDSLKSELTKLRNRITAYASFAQFPPLPTEREVYCIGTTIGSVNRRTQPDENSTNINAIVDKELNIHGKNESGDWYLASEQDSPLLVFWVSSSFVNAQCGEIPVIEASSVTVIDAPFGGEPLYLQTWQGLELIMKYALEHPEGWWGEDGLSQEELENWIMHHEVISDPIGYASDAEAIDLINTAVEGVYFRFRDAIQKRIENELDENYIPYFHFMSGLTPRVWGELTLPDGFDVTNPDSVSQFKAVNTYIYKGKTYLKQGTLSFIKFVQTEKDSLFKYDELQDLSANLHEQYDNVPFSEMREGFPLGAIYWWTCKEIPGHKRSEFGASGEGKTYNKRFVATDAYLYIGNYLQFQYAEVQGGITPEKQDDERQCL